MAKEREIISRGFLDKAEAERFAKTLAAVDPHATYEVIERNDSMWGRWYVARIRPA